MNNLVESFVLRVRCGPAGNVAEYHLDSNRTPLSSVLESFASTYALPPPPPGYELAVVTAEYDRQKFAFSGESTCILCKPSDVFPREQGPPDNEKLMCAVVQPEDELEDGQSRSFLRTGMTLFTDHDLGCLMYAKKDCAWFEEQGALLPV